MVEQRANVHAIEIIKNIPEDLPPVKADPTQLHQVFLNLFNNAIDAIIERYGASGGRLEVTAEINENDSNADHNKMAIVCHREPGVPEKIIQLLHWPAISRLVAKIVMY